MFELIFLGTSSSAPSVHRGLSSHMILHRQHRFLLDCGEGTQRQILQSGLGFKRLNKVLLTHGHLDHILGLGGLLSTLSRWENLEQIDIYGGRSTLARVRNLLFKVVFLGTRPPIDINLKDSLKFDCGSRVNNQSDAVIYSNITVYFYFIGIPCRVFDNCITNSYKRFVFKSSHIYPIIINTLL